MGCRILKRQSLPWERTYKFNFFNFWSRLAFENCVKTTTRNCVHISLLHLDDCLSVLLFQSFLSCLCLVRLLNVASNKLWKIYLKCCDALFLCVVVAVRMCKCMYLLLVFFFCPLCLLTMQLQSLSFNMCPSTSVRWNAVCNNYSNGHRRRRQRPRPGVYAHGYIQVSPWRNHWFVLENTAQ